MVVHLFLNNNKALDFLPINSIKNGGITDVPPDDAVFPADQPLQRLRPHQRATGQRHAQRRALQRKPPGAGSGRNPGAGRAAGVMFIAYRGKERLPETALSL